MFEYDGDAISDTEWSTADQERLEKIMEGIKRVEVEITNPVNEDETLLVECEYRRASLDGIDPEFFYIVEINLYLKNGYITPVDEQLFDEIVENMMEEIREKANEKTRRD